MKDRLQLILYYKNLLPKLENVVLNVDNKYRSLKTRMIDEEYSILELLYFANKLELGKRKYHQNKILAKISVLDYMFFQLFLKRQISKEKYEKISLAFLSLTKQIQGWMKYENNL